MPISLSITSSTSALKIGETADITFTFSDPPIGFTLGDIAIGSGTLSGLANQGGGVYTALFTPASGLGAAVGSISVAPGAYTDGFGGGGDGASMAPIVIDTLAPTVSIASSAAALKGGDSATLTFTFSEAPIDFTVGDLTATNGALSGFTATANPLVYTVVFTPSGGLTGTGVVSIAGGAYSDAAGNLGQGAVSSVIAIDTVAPSMVISSSQASLKAGETASITFTFSELPTGFDLADVSVSGGVLSDLQTTGNPYVYVATFTPTANIASGTATISVGNGAYSDLAGNAGQGASTPSLTFQTVRPTATIDVADSSLRIGESSLVNFTFSEAVTGFTTADVAVANGTLGSLSSIDGGVTWTAILTPSANVADPSNVITVDMTGVTNGVGNAGAGTTDSNPYAVDTARPTATITVANAALQAGQTSQVTIAFSESVTGFTTADLTVDNGVLLGLASSDGGRTWTANLTPSVGVADATNLITLDLAGVMDGVGNTGAGLATSNNYQVGYVPPAPPSQDDVLTTPAGGGEVAAGPGDDSVSGGAGPDVIQGNTGSDSLNGGGGDDVVRGGQDNDFVQGAVGADLLFGDGGDDSVFGGQGDDIVQGGAGADYVLGDLGRDTVLGGQGADTVFGGAGDDYLSGDLGDDVLVAGAGADVFNFNGGGGRDVVMDFSHSDGDRVRISPADAADFTALSAKFVADDGNTIINFGAQTIVLVGVAKTALVAADFLFG